MSIEMVPAGAESQKRSLEQVRRDMRKVIELLLSYRDRDRLWLSQQIGVHNSTLYRKFGDKSSDFSATEIYAIAQALDWDVSAFYQPASQLFHGPHGPGGGNSRGEVTLRYRPRPLRAFRVIKGGNALEAPPSMPPARCPAARVRLTRSA